jgi:peptide/nickel transport system permease protein
VSASNAIEEPAVLAAGATESPGFTRRLLRQRRAVVCLAYLALLVVIAIVAPLIWPEVIHQNAGDLLNVRQGPSGAHLLGTDTLGRDVLQRLLVGTRVTLVGVGEALVVILALGVPLGLVAGYFRGRPDRAVIWLTDLTYSLPGIIVILVILAVFPQSMTAALIAFGVIAAPDLIRVVRSAALPVREELYIEAARISGLSAPYIMGKHVLPRISGAIIVQVSLLAAAALLTQSGLAFLNLVVSAPAPSWGAMLGEGVSTLRLQPWLIWPPGIAIGLTILALGVLADAIRDAAAEGWSTPVGRRKRRWRRGSSSSRQAPPASEKGAVLAVNGLTVGFESRDGTTRIVDHVDFEVMPGETVGIVGESGCGKTMTAMAVLGLLPGTGTVESGTVWFDGQDLAGLSERELARVRGRGIALISQEPMVSLDPAFRVGSQLAEVVRQHHGIGRRAAKERTLELLRMVHLPDPETVARRYPHELSGGMAQRVAIARALAGEPRLLIADEPTTALDVTVQAEILALLRELQQETGMAVLLVTHDWGVVADSCERVIVMYAGEVVETADVDAVFDVPFHPYTAALLAANPHGAPPGEVLATIPGSVPAPGEWPTGCRFHARCDFCSQDCVARAIALEAPAADRETRCIHHQELVAAHD